MLQLRLPIFDLFLRKKPIHIHLFLLHYLAIEM